MCIQAHHLSSSHCCCSLTACALWACEIFDALIWVTSLPKKFPLLGGRVRCRNRIQWPLDHCSWILQYHEMVFYSPLWVRLSQLHWILLFSVLNEDWWNQLIPPGCLCTLLWDMPVLWSRWLLWGFWTSLFRWIHWKPLPQLHLWVCLIPVLAKPNYTL